MQKPESDIQKMTTQLREGVVKKPEVKLQDDEDGDGHYEVHVNTMEGLWSLLRSWLRPHRGIPQEKLSFYLRVLKTPD